MGRCGCASVDTCGCIFDASGGLTASGLGSATNPIVIAPDADRRLPIVCTSSTRPLLPAVGQTIFETNTGLLRVWSGGYWRPLQDQTFDLDAIVENGSASAITTFFSSGAFAGAVDYPFRMQVDVAVHYGFSAIDNVVQVYLDSPEGTGIWRPLTYTGVVELTQRTGKWDHSLLSGWRDYPNGGTPTFFLRYAVVGGGNAYVRCACRARIVPKPV